MQEIKINLLKQPRVIELVGRGHAAATEGNHLPSRIVITWKTKQSVKTMLSYLWDLRYLKEWAGSSDIWGYLYLLLLPRTSCETSLPSHTLPAESWANDKAKLGKS